MTFNPPPHTVVCANYCLIVISADEQLKHLEALAFNSLHEPKRVRGRFSRAAIYKIGGATDEILSTADLGMPPQKIRGGCKFLRRRLDASALANRKNEKTDLGEQ